MQHKCAQKSLQNKILFCEKPWQIPAVALTALVVFTFLWAFYLLDETMEHEFDEFSVSDFFHPTAGSATLQDIMNTVPPAVTGISGGNVNSPALGSGVIVSSSGYVITALHLIDNLDTILAYVDTPSGHRAIEAQVVKSVPEHDLVMLKLVTTDHFMYLRLADTNGLQPGEPVYAIGQGIGSGPIVKAGAVLETNLSLAVGVQNLSHVIRTDAVYNWAQTGGALVNANGELAGVNMAIVGVSGLLEGYALPADVLAAHFADVINFKPAPGASPNPRGTRSPGTQGDPPLRGSAAWWNNARNQLAPAPAVPPMGLNTVMNNPGPAGIPDTGARTGAAHPLGTRIGGYRIEDIIGLALLALTAGVVGGMMTMGGGVLQVVGMMVLFGYGMYLIRPVAYLTNIVVYGAAALRNKESGLLHWPGIRGALPWAVVGVVAGYFLGNMLEDRSIGYILGVFALAMGLKVGYEMMAEAGLGVAAVAHGATTAGVKRDELDELLDPEERPPAHLIASDLVKHSALGVPVGLISGMLGISGGVAGVPIQHYVNGVALRNAIANASVLVFCASLSGAVIAFSHGVSAGIIDWQAPVTLAIVMAPGAYVGGLAGAKLTAVLDQRVLRIFYVLIMLGVAGRMLLGAP